jgi:hypothetical protein
MSAEVAIGDMVVMSQPLPFEPRDEPSLEVVFRDVLPAYVDWESFRFGNGPGRGFVQWMNSLIPRGADVVQVATRSLGRVPLIAERARPPLPRDPALLRQELDSRMPPVGAREPKRQAPWKFKPMWEINSAFARDICGMDTVGIAQALGLGDYFMTGLVGSEQGSRGGRRYAEAGRARLSRLGAWPWCLTEDGELQPDTWFHEQKYARSLARWHYQQWLAVFAAQFRSFALAAPHPPTPLTKRGAAKYAKARYREFYLSFPLPGPTPDE